VNGIRIRIGHATLLIIVLPIRMKLSAGNTSRLRVSVNHVPQNTPVTNMTSIRFIHNRICLFIRIILSDFVHAKTSSALALPGKQITVVQPDTACTSSKERLLPYKFQQQAHHSCCVYATISTAKCDTGRKEVKNYTDVICWFTHLYINHLNTSRERLFKNLALWSQLHDAQL